MAVDSYATCIAACLACAEACDRCVGAAPTGLDLAAVGRCAELCRLVASFMLRGSETGLGLGRTCAEVCARCGEDCMRHEASAAVACAKACERCASECQQLCAQPGAYPGLRAVVATQRL